MFVSTGMNNTLAPSQRPQSVMFVPQIVSRKRRNVAEQNTVLLAALSGAGRRPSNKNPTMVPMVDCAPVESMEAALSGAGRRPRNSAGVPR